MTITGEWNGQMFAKWADSGKNELFVDTKTLPIIKKQVAPISEQDEFESRNIWKDVTVALKKQDVNGATKAKYDIEQKQRILAKEREDKSLKWQNRVIQNLFFVFIVLKCFKFFRRFTLLQINGTIIIH